MSARGDAGLKPALTLVRAVPLCCRARLGEQRLVLERVREIDFSLCHGALLTHMPCGRPEPRVRRQCLLRRQLSVGEHVCADAGWASLAPVVPLYVIPPASKCLLLDRSRRSGALA